MSQKKQSFEDSLAELEKIVTKLEEGDLPLEESLELFEKGVGLSRECQERLNLAERRIEVLLKDQRGEPVLETLDGQRIESVEIVSSKVITFKDDKDEDDDIPF
ncbi:MAG TPA: exodeoxyribonuclease VII small subunit [Pyrinomonadaceae bacterium]|jgi:exodeoxyribonuclease VII small subunit|nr:exodeoxyribonuclease VII small subunit [Pyrinomonadaceae bacterium]